MAYQELIKNFERIRSYMREFYVYGFKSRSEYDAKSARSYDDERRRIESWLGKYMRFSQTPEGKNVFLSVDSRAISHNPFYKAWKARSFTDGDITLHFILFDILHDPSVKLTLQELTRIMDEEYLNGFPEPMTFDESTLRKKLKEYEKEGIIKTEKQGRQVLYSRAAETDISELQDTLDYFSEAAPCGVIGSFLLDRLEENTSPFAFKHHYITQTVDSDVLASLFTAMGNKSCITAVNCGRHIDGTKTLQLVPLRIYISTQNGRQYLIAYHPPARRLNTYRLDYLADIRETGPCPEFDSLRQWLGKMERHMWGVNCKRNMKQLEHVEFIIRIRPGEEYIVHRLEREKRCGRVVKLDDLHYKYVADVFDSKELNPWIRTFTCRITQMDFSNRTVENIFRADLEEMYRMYGLDGGESQ